MTGDAAAEAVTCTGLAYAFGGTKAVDGLDPTVREGEVYPVSVMPGWLQAVSKVNPLSHQVDALRGLLLGTPADLPADFVVLAVAAALGIAAASSLLGRPAR